MALGWDAPVEDAGSVTGYEILRGQGEDDPETLVSDTGNADTTYTGATAGGFGFRTGCCFQRETQSSQ